MSFIFLQCLGWGTLFAINFLMMWLASAGAAEKSLNILVFLVVAVACSFALRKLLKPVSQGTPIIKLACLALAYSFVMGMVTVQLGVILLAILPEVFGGQAEFKVNVFIIITLAWSAVFVVWSLFYLFIQRQRALQQSIENESRLDSLLAKARLNVLHSQISPHFIFNSINNIRALVLEDKSRAREMLASLSEILRYSLYSNPSSQVPLSEELEVVEQYLALCSIQFEQRLQQNIDVDASCLAVSVPTMSIQMLVENAIKHGIAECITPGVLLIKVFPADDNVIIEVRNSGKLRDIAPSNNKIGIKNIRQRLKLLYGEHASLVVQQQQQLVVAKLQIPQG